MVLQHKGEQAWVEVCDKAGFAEGDFLSFHNYPDEVTFKLVDAAALKLDIPSHTILELFGEYWITYTAKEGYSEMLDVSGSTLLEFLENLDMLHFRVRNIMSELRPPKFVTTSISETEVQVDYFSERSGLAPMVIGLLKGLAKRFEVAAEIIHVESKLENGECERFSIKW